MHHDVIMAGFGGQGILMIGNVLAVAALRHGYRVTFFPAYGVEMRGGTANCTVTISDREIGSPVTSRPLGVIAMNEPSAVKFGARMRAGGTAVVNGSLVPDGAFRRDDVRVVRVPCNEIALDLGEGRLASMVALGAYVRVTGVVPLERVSEGIGEILEGRSGDLLALNRKALQAGAESVERG